MSELVFRKIERVEPVAEYVAQAIASRLQAGQRVLWLVSGGSAIEVAVAAAALLKGTNFGGLTVTLADERFGPVGHADSNWLQLEKAGFVLEGAAMVPILCGDDLTVTARKFDVRLQGLFSEADYSLALLGIGTDSHTAGILPDTSAVNALGMAYGYVTPKFSRVTITADALAKVNEVVAYVLGEAKRPVLEGLQQDQDPKQYPAQFIKRVRKVTIFNDQLGEA